MTEDTKELARVIRDSKKILSCGYFVCKSCFKDIKESEDYRKEDFLSRSTVRLYDLPEVVCVCCDKEYEKTIDILSGYHGDGLGKFRKIRMSQYGRYR